MDFSLSEEQLALQNSVRQFAAKELPEIAKQILNDLKWTYDTYYDEKDAVGRRYRRQDALGTPYCITIDHQTKQDETVTIRDRDTMLQERIPLKHISALLEKKLNLKNWLNKN